MARDSFEPTEKQGAIRTALRGGMYDLIELRLRTTGAMLGSDGRPRGRWAENSGSVKTPADLSKYSFVYAAQRMPSRGIMWTPSDSQRAQVLDPRADHSAIAADPRALFGLPDHRDPIADEAIGRSLRYLSGLPGQRWTMRSGERFPSRPRR